MGEGLDGVGGGGGRRSRVRYSIKKLCLFVIR